MDNRREHIRTPLSVKVRIKHPDIGEKVVSTKNISDSGLFIVIEPTVMPAIGEIVTGQVLGMLDDPPSVKMEIVRHQEDGVGLRFVQDES